jgi:hypothetical protein
MTEDGLKSKVNKKLEELKIYASTTTAIENLE